MRVLDPTHLSNFKLGQKWLRKDQVNSRELRANLTFRHQTLPGGELTQFIETETHFVVPRHYSDSSVARLDVTDFTVPGEQIRFTDRVTRFLDAQQEAAWNALRRAREGVLVIPGGRGKTVLALKKIAHEGQAALVFVHNTVLMDQWRERAREFLGLRSDQIGTFAKNLHELERPLVLASIQTVMNRVTGILPPARDRFGTILFDECHHIGAARFSEVAPLFRGNRFGITATPRRADNLDAVYTNHLGPVFYESTFHSLSPTIIVKDMPEFGFNAIDFEVSGSLSFPKLWTALTKCRARNHFLRDEVEWYTGQGRTVLALTPRVNHARLMATAFPDSGVLAGPVLREDRPHELSKDLVFATYPMAAEGLDKPALDTVLLMTPIGSEAMFNQAIYRTLREYSGKLPPLVIIYRDTLDVCRALVTKMVEYAERKNYRIEGTEATVDSLRQVPSVTDTRVARLRRGRE